MNHSVELTGITKAFGDLQVLHSLDLAIPEGSFTALLGPSGCGKTTILNLIGGLDDPTGGSIAIGGQPVFDRQRRINQPAERRNIGYVFQTYALWPHMTVGQNVAYPLKIRGVSKVDREKQAVDILAKLELGHLVDRYPFQISGGQQQRVAIARALVYRARLLLLDEPLSNLDTQLRERARAWLAEVHSDFELTTILVTHDQTEALSLSDRIILLDRGRIAQDGSALDVYEAPQSAYAADFVGGANLLPVEVVAVRDQTGRTLADVTLAESGRLTVEAAKTVRPGEASVIMVRPTKIRVLPSHRHAGGQGETAIPFETRTVLYQGASYEIVGDTPLGRLRVLADQRPETGTPLLAVIPWDACRCLPT
jgi:iron(III) transport system ATP-binding protein